ncbi:hypothetical protein BZA70DRAFT_280512 [Myxozyma melibiosi]|uniref:NADH dehydrogenase [ubiquinone] 1 beta subcomplex subunit 9 n=1 Tax=Myxozyma melibiosi TaxID=54550 RepID=A0ABR1F5F9_9ASCO
MSAFTPFSPQHVFSIYRRALRTTLSWTIRRDIWRQEALQIRAQLESNKDVIDPRKIRELITAAELKLRAGRHPDPYIPPSRPGGSKYERNFPPSCEPPIDGPY